LLLIPIKEDKIRELFDFKIKKERGKKLKLAALIHCQARVIMRDVFNEKVVER
jgi:hypothetical protein